VFPDSGPSREAVPAALWALAMFGERMAADLKERFGGYTWAEAGREDHEMGAAPTGELLRLQRPPEPGSRTIGEARQELDGRIPDLWPDEERLRLGEGHHALRTGNATHELSIAPRPFRLTVRLLTRLVGDLEPAPALLAEMNGWNEGLGFASFGFLEEERMLVCSSVLPGTFLEEEALGELLRLHAALARQHGEAVLETYGGRTALEVQADR
jgi:hypothetical protein